MKKLIATLIACLMAGTACAQDQRVIDYSDVDVTTPDGADALYRRIANASEEVCHRESLPGVQGYFIWRSCAREAIARAVSKVDTPLLTARHHGETPDRLYSSRATTK